MELALRKRSWSRSFSRFTRQKQMAWAWAFRSAARLSRTTEASSSRSPTMAQELHFVSLSPNTPDLTKREKSYASGLPRIIRLKENAPELDYSPVTGRLVLETRSSVEG